MNKNNRITALDQTAAEANRGEVALGLEYILLGKYLSYC